MNLTKETHLSSTTALMIPKVFGKIIVNMWNMYLLGIIIITLLEEKNYMLCSKGAYGRDMYSFLNWYICTYIYIIIAGLVVGIMNHSIEFHLSQKSY